MNEDKWTNKLENYRRALLSLEEAKGQYLINPANKVIRAGLIKNFEFCIELAWRVMKLYLEGKGEKDSSTPKDVLRKAYEHKLINEGEQWLRMVDYRNETSHNYDEDFSVKMATMIVEEFSPLFHKFYDWIQTQS